MTDWRLLRAAQTFNIGRNNKRQLLHHTTISGKKPLAHPCMNAITMTAGQVKTPITTSPHSEATRATLTLAESRVKKRSASYLKEIF